MLGVNACMPSVLPQVSMLLHTLHRMGGWAERASFGLAVVMAMELSMILHLGPNPTCDGRPLQCGLVLLRSAAQYSVVLCGVPQCSRVMFLELVCTVPMCGRSPVLQYMNDRSVKPRKKSLVLGHINTETGW